jgi:GNAT superfamily N-acetyltransferase
VTDPPRFHSKAEIPFSSLAFEPFRQVAEVDRFTCGSPDLDRFIKSEEVVVYSAQGYGQTTLVWQAHSLVAYYTVGRGELAAEELHQGKRSFHTKRWFVEENIPALKIGRLAVSRPLQRKGLGRLLVAKIANDAVESGDGPRLLLTRANPGSLDFWQKCAFQPVASRPKKATSTSMTLFFRLDVLAINDPRAEFDL